METIDIAGVKVDKIGVKGTLGKISEFVLSGTPHMIVTTYSEFIVEAQKNDKFREAVNKADLSVADGIGILWAAKFLSLPKRDMVITYLNWLGTLGSIILSPESVRTVLPEQVVGRKLIWDIAGLAEKNNFSIALVGALDDIAERAASVLKARHPNLKINLSYNPGNFDEATIAKIAESNSDILLVAYQPPKQEIWLSDNLQRLNTKVAIGLGGTFDYLAGDVNQAPEWMSRMGLEWMHRLVTQPWRWKRMWKALVEFSWIILNTKLNK